jgi:hypothetical protein
MISDTLQEYRDLKACFEPYSREAIDRHEAAYPTSRPVTFREFRGLSEADRMKFWIDLGADAPFWQISECLVWVGSHHRTEPMLLTMAGAHRTAERQLCIFLDTWSMCDATRPYWSQIAGELRSARAQVDITEFLEPEAHAWFSAAPAEITVYRGCQAGRERGLSWTIDQSIAIEFAHGKRLPNRTPMLVTAVIPKEHVFAVVFDRSEQELVIDPRRLRQVRKEAIEQSPTWGTPFNGGKAA